MFDRNNAIEIRSKRMNIRCSPKLVVVAVLVCVVLSSPSYGQEPREMEANVQVGMVSGIGTHGTFGGGFGVGLAPRVLGYAELSYIPLGSGSSSVPGLGLQSAASARAINFNLGGQYQFSRAGSVEPYAGVGLGVLHASSSYSTSVGGTIVSGENSSKDLYFNLGGGLRYHVNERWGFRPELMIFAGSNAYVRLGGGIFYRLGR
jgi:hypothetical protein